MHNSLSPDIMITHLVSKYFLTNSATDIEHYFNILTISCIKIIIYFLQITKLHLVKLLT